MDSGGNDRSILDLDPGRVGRVLALTVGGLILAHCLGLFSRHVLGYDRLLGLVPLFNMDLEQKVPSFVSTTCFLLGAVGFYLLDRFRPLGGPTGRHWLVLAVVFVFLSLDDAIEIHERLSSPVRELLGASGFFYFAWIIPYGIATGVLGVYLLPRILALPARVRTPFLASAATYLLGTVVMVGVGGFFGEAYDALPVAQQAVYEHMLAYDLVETVEDGLELCGQAMMLYAQVLLLRIRMPELRIRFGHRSTEG